MRPRAASVCRLRGSAPAISEPYAIPKPERSGLADRQPEETALLIEALQIAPTAETVPEADIIPSFPPEACGQCKQFRRSVSDSVPLFAGRAGSPRLSYRTPGPDDGPVTSEGKPDGSNAEALPRPRPPCRPTWRPTALRVATIKPHTPQPSPPAIHIRAPRPSGWSVADDRNQHRQTEHGWRKAASMPRRDRETGT